MKKSKFLIPMAVILLALNGCGAKEETQETAASAEANNTITPVEVQEIQPETIVKQLTYGGKVNVDKTVNVTPKVSGRVASINVDVGDKVQAGQVLFTVDKEDIQKQIAQMRATLAVSDAGVASAQTGLNQIEGGQTQSSRLSMENAVKNAQTAVDNAQVSMDTAKTALDDTEKKYNDYKIMLDAGVISQRDYDAVELGHTQAQNAYEQAKLGYDQAVRSLAQAEDSLRIFNEQTIQDSKNTAQAGVNTASANRNSVLVQISQLEDTLKDYTVVSPISGVITARNIEVTNTVSPASVPFVISATDVVNVDTDISEKMINKVSVGDKVSVVINTISDEAITGTVKTVNSVANPTGTYTITVSVDNSSGTIKPGMYAAVTFTEEHSENTVVVPRNTILENETEQYVFVADGNKAAKKVVETGVDNGEQIEIVSGISTGDKVVVSGQSYLTDGSAINVVTGEE